jgi:hypothetical protein
MVAETVEELASYSRKSGVPHLRSAVRLDSARNLETATGEAFVPLFIRDFKRTDSWGMASPCYVICGAISVQGTERLARGHRASVSNSELEGPKVKWDATIPLWFRREGKSGMEKDHVVPSPGP